MSGNGNEIVLEIVKAWPNLNGYQRQALVGATQGPVISDAQGRGKDLMIVVSNLVKSNQTLEEKRELASLLLEMAFESNKSTKAETGEVKHTETKTGKVETGGNKTVAEAKTVTTKSVTLPIATAVTTVTDDQSKQPTDPSKKQDVDPPATTGRLMYCDILFQSCFYTGFNLIRSNVRRITLTNHDTFKDLKMKILLALCEKHWSIKHIDVHKDDEHTHGHQIRNAKNNDLVTSFSLTSCTKPLVVIFE